MPSDKIAKQIPATEGMTNILKGCEDLSWGCTLSVMGERELVAGMVIGHDAYIDLVLEYLPDDFQERLQQLYEEMIYVQEETKTKH